LTQFGKGALATWEHIESAPGDDVARLLSVRVRTEEGVTAEHIDIRKPVGIEMEYMILQSGRILVPNAQFLNGEGVYVFISVDNGSLCKTRVKGRYKSIVWVPGNFLAEGTFMVSVALATMEPLNVHIFEKDAVAFQVIDTTDGDSNRGVFAGEIPGLVRPTLKWETQCILGE